MYANIFAIYLPVGLGSLPVSMSWKFFIYQQSSSQVV